MRHLACGEIVYDYGNCRFVSWTCSVASVGQMSFKWFLLPLLLLRMVKERWWDILEITNVVIFVIRMVNDGFGLSWLQKQQQKLRERKDSIRRSERQPAEARLLSELRAAQSAAAAAASVSSAPPSTTSSTRYQRPGDDGYLSDVTLFSETNTSREGSPDVGNLYATPLHINTVPYGQYQVKIEFT